MEEPDLTKEEWEAILEELGELPIVQSRFFRAITAYFKLLDDM